MIVVDAARRGRTELCSRRALGWSEWGPQDGAVVLFCPGAATSSALGFGAGALEELGLRLVALDRPGCGASDRGLDDRTLLDWADDVRSLVEARALGVPGIVGFSQGAPFTLACAAAGIVSAAAIVSGTDELAAPHQALAPDLRGLIDLAATDPAGAEAMFRTMTAEKMRQMVLAGSDERDLTIYRDPAFDALYRQALDECFAAGPEGYARDTVLAFSAWPFDPRNITVPVELWYGARDASPVHSPDHGASLQARIPGARREVIADAGGALLWTHAHAILAALARQLRPAG